MRVTKLFLLAVLALSACSPPPANSDPALPQADTIKSAVPESAPLSLEGPQWKLIELSGAPIDSARNPGGASIQFDPATQEVNGSTGCNSFGGTYEIGKDQHVKLSELLMTQMACGGDNIEPAYVNALREVDNYVLSDSALTLNNAAMVPLARFRAE